MSNKMHALEVEFHDLFEPGSESPQRSCMYWGFDVGEGWHDLLRTMLLELRALGGVQLTQVKEKYGTLRVYTALTGDTVGWDAVDEIVDRAELVSARTCDVCGAPGCVRGRGWFSTRCDEHSEGRAPYEEVV